MTLTIRNYRALRDISIPLSRFVCLIGENNAGKSSFLQAYSLFSSGDSLKATDYFDDSKEVYVSVAFENVSAKDLQLLGPEHQKKIAPLVKDGRLTLARRWGADRKSQLGYVDMVPTAERFQASFLDNLIKGKMVEAKVAEILRHFPELQDSIVAGDKQETIKDAIIRLASSQPPEAKESAFVPIPTGGGFSVSPLLPDVIYIAAVKDLNDETKTTQSSSFGKILSILTNQIRPLLDRERALFRKLSEKITRVRTETGEIEDLRLPQVREIESRIQRLLRDTFSNATLELEIPPPSISSILGTAQIIVDDGIRGSLDQKGDGLRRAVVFSILRAYVELSGEQSRAALNSSTSEEMELIAAADSELRAAAPKNYILLFEEPELYLHPDAQRILFDALRIFSTNHNVIVTTHSPLFLGPKATETFVRLAKVEPSDVSKPYTTAVTINLDGIEERDEFQIICYENNAAAFFCRGVVLVEGDSDVIVFPHLASVLNSEWTRLKTSIAFTRVNGKGSIPRYRRFFGRFGIPTYVIADLDVIEKGLNEFHLAEPVPTTRSRLLTAIDKHLKGIVVPDPRSSDIKVAHGSKSIRDRWLAVRLARENLETDGTGWNEFQAAVEEFFAWEKTHVIRDALQVPPTPEIAMLKDSLLRELRDQNVFILRKGVIEDYYPTTVSNGDKPTRARSLCEEIRSKHQIASLSEEVDCHRTNTKVREIEMILGDIFGNIASSAASDQPADH